MKMITVTKVVPVTGIRQNTAAKMVFARTVANVGMAVRFLTLNLLIVALIAGTNSSLTHRKSQSLSGMNVNRLSQFFPSLFLGGGLARPRELSKMMMRGMSMTDTYQQIGICPAFSEQ